MGHGGASEGFTLFGVSFRHGEDPRRASPETYSLWTSLRKRAPSPPRLVIDMIVIIVTLDADEYCFSFKHALAHTPGTIVMPGATMGSCVA